LLNPVRATDLRMHPRCSIEKLYIDDEAEHVRGENIWL